MNRNIYDEVYWTKEQQAQFESKKELILECCGKPESECRCGEKMTEQELKEKIATRLEQYETPISQAEINDCRRWLETHTLLPYGFATLYWLPNDFIDQILTLIKEAQKPSEDKEQAIEKIGQITRSTAIRAIEAYLTAERRVRRNGVASQILIALERLGYRLIPSKLEVLSDEEINNALPFDDFNPKLLWDEVSIRPLRIVAQAAVDKIQRQLEGK
jgi:hypothetical protein